MSTALDEPRRSVRPGGLLAWLRGPYKPVGTSHYGDTCSRLSVLVRVVLSALLVAGAVWGLKHYGAWEWARSSTNLHMGLVIYLLACAAFRIQPFDERRVVVPYSQDRTLFELQLVFLPGQLLVDTAWDVLLTARYARLARGQRSPLG